MSNTTLMNFRAPNQVKNEFNQICKLTCTNMTAEIVRFMMDFVSERSQRVKDCQIESSQVNNPTLERHGNLIKDPISGTWVNKSDWGNNYEL